MEGTTEVIPGTSMFPQALLLILLSGTTVFLDIPPLIWHVKNRNLAASSLIVWIILQNLMNFANAIIWPNDDIDSWWEGYGLCDVEVKVSIGYLGANPGALTCIMRALAAVMDTSRTALAPSTAQRRRELAITLGLCWGFPVYLMVTHYIVQPDRYLVFGISGCTGTLDGSWLSIVLILIWPPILAILNTCYAVLLIVRMHRYRSEFSKLLRCSNTTKARFMRLLVLAISLIIVQLPLQAYILYLNVRLGATPYSWSRTHGKLWETIAAAPSYGDVVFDRWITVGTGFLVFIFFGLGDDAVRMYRGWICKLRSNRVFSGLAKKDTKSEKTKWGATKMRERANSLFKNHRKHPPSLTTNSSLLPSSVGTVIDSPKAKSYMSSGTQTDRSLSEIPFSLAESLRGYAGFDAVLERETV